MRRRRRKRRKLRKRKRNKRKRTPYIKFVRIYLLIKVRRNLKRSRIIILIKKGIILRIVIKVKVIVKIKKRLWRFKIKMIVRLILWWGGWSPHHFSLHNSLCLDMSILRHLHTRIRESILSISLSSRLSRAIGQSPY